MSSEVPSCLRRKRSGGSAACEGALQHPEISIKRVEKVTVQLWKDLPAWQRIGNEYIESGYRPAAPSYRVCLKSWLYLHNESVNIFSHLIGAVLFIALSVGVLCELQPRYESATSTDVVVLALYFAGVTICFSLSVVFHTVMCHSESVFHFGIQFDFQGIVVLMWSASIPMTYYSFRCDSRIQRTYWAVVSGFAVLASIVTFTPQFRKPSARPIRAAVFGSLAISTLLPIIHGTMRHGWEEQDRRFPMWTIGLTMLLNCAGALAYAIKFPERWFRRKFDSFGASHQIMHVLIVFAGISFVVGCFEAFGNAHNASHLCTREAAQQNLK